MPELVYDVKFRIDPASAQRVAGAASGTGAGGTASAGQGAEKAAQEVKQLEVSLDRAAEAAEDLGAKSRKALKETQDSLKRSGNAAIDYSNKLGTAASRTTKGFSTANQVLFSFSDGINDAAQFSQGFGVGMRAVGNNIGFTIELLTSLNNRVQQHNALVKAGAIENGKMMTTFGMLRASLAGPGGLLLAVNAAITLMTVLGTRTKKAEEEVSRLAEVMRELRQVGELDFGIAASLESEEQAIIRVIDQFKVLEEAQKQLQAEVALSAVFGRNEEFIRLQEEAINEQREAVLIIAESYGFEEKSLKELEARLKSVTRAREIFTGGTGDAEIALGAFVDTLDGKAQEALIRQELGLSGSNEEVERQRRVLGELIQEWTAVVNAGDDSLIPFLAKLKQAYDDLAPDDAALPTPDPVKVSKNYDLLTDIFLQKREKPTESALLRLRDLEEQLARETIEDDDEFAFERLKIHAKYFDGIIALRKEEIDDARNIFRINRELLILEEEQNEDSVKKFENIQKYRLDILRTSAEYQLMSDAEKELARQKIIFDSEKQITKFKENEAKKRLQIEADAERAIQQVKAQGIQGIAALSQAAAGSNEQLALGLLAVEKGLRIADVIVNAKAAIAKITAAGAVRQAALDPTAAASMAKNIALVKGSAAISIAAILAQGLGKGGGVGGGSAGGVRTESPFGFQMNEVEGAQTFQTPGFMPTSGTGSMAPKVNVEILADRKKLYYIVKQGEEEYRQAQA